MQKQHGSMQARKCRVGIVSIAWRYRAAIRMPAAAEGGSGAHGASLRALAAAWPRDDGRTKLQNAEFASDR
jgi:hypothetical protein